MNSYALPTTTSSDHEKPLLHAIQRTLAQYQTWQIARQQIQSQILTDFQSDDLTIDQAYELLCHMTLWADVLRWIAQQIENEVAQTEDGLTEWACD
jgi:hypothetical protein